MRSNGLCLALLTVLAPAPGLAQTAPPPAGLPEPEVSAPATPTTTPAPTGPSTTEPPPSATAQDAVPPAGAPEPAEPATATEAPATDGPADATAQEPTDAVTEAERAFAEIYGAQQYDPVADPTLPEAAVLPGTFDPWEKYNRKMHRFNNAVDRTVAKPLARGYVKVVPRPVRLGVSNFFNNLGQPLTAINSLLQGNGRQAGQAFGRFLLNSTFGVGGIFDPATRAKLPQKSEDFGQTLGVWGWKRSRYFELPLFGPRTVRDMFGMVGDAPLSPLRGVEADRVRVPLQGLQLVDMRSQLLSTDALREGVEDDYALVRDAWSQRRDYQIFGDRQLNGEDLPDYLHEGEEDSTVPVDAMPVPVPAPGGGAP